MNNELFEWLGLLIISICFWVGLLWTGESIAWVFIICNGLWLTSKLKL